MKINVIEGDNDEANLNATINLFDFHVVNLLFLGTFTRWSKKCLCHRSLTISNHKKLLDFYVKSPKKEVLE